MGKFLFPPYFSTFAPREKKRALNIKKNNFLKNGHY